MRKTMALSWKWILLMNAIWCVLMGSFQIGNIVLGFFIGLFSVWFSERYITGFYYGTRYPISFTLLIKYALFLVTEIIRAGLNTLKLLILGRSNPVIVTVETDLKTAMGISLLANSVTLTPGTVTVDVDGKNLKILWLEGKPLSGHALKNELIGSLEEKLLKLEAKI